MKIDLHVHSKFSSKPSQWFLQKLGCPESFVEPEQVYRLARQKGMDMVTISDHNVIDGAVAIAHLPGVFISEEISALFPEDGCKVHVLAWRIDERIHQDLQRMRRNIYELVDYLRDKNIPHGLAHPLYATNDKLDLLHLEKLLVLFNTFEVNGTRDSMQNNNLRKILELLDAASIDHLADKHNIAPYGAEPWKKCLTGGSDDHSGLNIARIFTEVEDAQSREEFFLGISQGRSRPRGEHASPKTMAHNLYGIGFQFFKDRYKLQPDVNKDKFLKFLDLLLSPESPDPKGLGGLYARAVASVRHSRLMQQEKTIPDNPTDLFRHKANEIFRKDSELLERARCSVEYSGQAEEHWFDFVNRTAHSVLAHYAEKLLNTVTSANIFELFQTMASSGALYTALSPYFVAYNLFTKDRAFCRKALGRALALRDLPEARDMTKQPFKLAHFTDTFFETNGVAMTMQEHVRLVEQNQDKGKDLTVITCHPVRNWDSPRVRNFKPIGEYDLPEYPELKLLYPPVLEMLSWIYENEFTHIHVATPGPVGLTGLLIARILKLPIAGTYHTALPQYTGQLTGDHAMEELMWRFMIWFYNEMDQVYAPSQAFSDELAEKGVQRHKLRVYPRGVDVRQFTPAKRNGFYKRFSLNGNTKMIYVGRISKEKNMPLLEQVILKLAERVPALDVVLVGDGPYREEMQNNLKGVQNCVFTGTLYGEDLAQAYASADFFVFPSTTDTFGKVILEAQASGLPVIVSDKGGPQENLVPGETGLVVPSDEPEALLQAVEQLLSDPDKLQVMGRNARRYTDNRSLEQSFDQTWRMYTTN